MLGAVGTGDDQLGVALRFEFWVRQHVDDFIAFEPQRFPRLARLELQRQHAHADQVAAVDALKTACHHGFDAQQLRAFGGPVAGRAGAVFLTRKNHGGRASGHVLHGGVVNEHFFLAGLEQRHAALFPGAGAVGRNHQVFDAHVGKGAAHHHIVVAAPRAIAVEVGLLHALRLQPQPSGGAGLDGPSGRDVVGGDGVAKQGHDAGVFDGILVIRAASPRFTCRSSYVFHSKILEERWLGNVGAGGPGVAGARHTLDFFPQLARLGLDLGVVGAEGLAVHRVLHELFNLVRGGPNVTQVNRLAFFAVAHRLGHQVTQHGAGNRVRHHQRRAGQKIGLQVGVDARFKIAVARQHGRADQVVLRDGVVDLGRQIPGVADAGGAAVASQ